jgi:hypothetical protein
MHRSLVSLIISGALITAVHADERLEGIACRSVHLRYPAGEGIAFYNEITVIQSAEGTYFCVCGFNRGYFGILELASGKKLLIFSVWDPGNQDDPTAVKQSDRVQLTHKDPAVRVGRFGNEGTGGQSFYDYDWKLGVTYRFLVKSKPAGGRRVEYAGWFLHPETRAWKHLVSFTTISSKPLGGYYSFVEDFRRNRISATRTRAALFGNGWMQTADGQWHELTQARFTADSNPSPNINAKLERDRFSLGTGGDLVNDGTKLGDSLIRAGGETTAPEVP